MKNETTIRVRFLKFCNFYDILKFTLENSDRNSIPVYDWAQNREERRVIEEKYDTPEEITNPRSYVVNLTPLSSDRIKPNQVGMKFTLPDLSVCCNLIGIRGLFATIIRSWDFIGEYALHVGVIQSEEEIPKSWPANYSRYKRNIQRGRVYFNSEESNLIIHFEAFLNCLWLNRPMEFNRFATYNRQRKMANRYLDDCWWRAEFVLMVPCYTLKEKNSENLEILRQ